MRKNLPRLLPLVYVGLLAMLFPYFDAGFTEGLSYVRVGIGRLAMGAGMQTEAKGILLGIFKPEVPYSLGRLDSLELGMDKKFDILSFYQTWGEREEDGFPLDLVRAVDAHGATAMITWEPWLTEFRRTKPDTAAAIRTDLRAIARGGYDDYVRSWARDAVVFGKPFFLRFAHEMNNPQYPWSDAAGNTPEDFQDAWRHVWRVFRDEGAKNVAWVWSPKGTMPHSFYPGGEYVDWIGTGVFNYGAYGEGWLPFEYLYGPIYRSALRYDKPIMLAEVGCSRMGGSQHQWYVDALKLLPTSYPETKALVLYDNPADYTLPGSVIDWSVGSDAGIVELFRGLVQTGLFK
jgi:hypothetical protein